MTIDGPESEIASPMMTKMPVPMIAPMPSAVRSRTPTARLSPASSSDVSRMRCSVGLRAKSPGRAVVAIDSSSRGGWCLPFARRRPRLNDETGPRRTRARFRPRAPLHSKVVPEFRLDPIFTPAADQPRAIDEAAGAIVAGDRMVTLLGATGTGKTMTMAGIIERVQRPTLVMAHNKTLAAQLCNEFRTFFPDNAVEYFVSYYDYYQPEAYVPSKDLYIEKDSAINQEVDRLRHAATAAVFARRDVVVVASVSAIFGLGSPETYEMNMQVLRKGDEIDRDKLLRKLVSIQYSRNDTALGRGTFRVRGETLEVFPAYAETAFRVTMFGDEVERLQHFDPLTGELIKDDLEHVAVWPATHYNVKEGTMERAVEEIGRELNERCAQLEAEGKLLESHRLRQRTQYDMEMLREVGFCSGIENYSRLLDGRPPGARPYCLIDYFPDDFVCFIDESHQTVPQLGGMYEGDRSRKQSLVEYGFRLPSALDNRPQTFQEFLSITPQTVFVSATPGQ